ncbi:MAG: acylphosphatase [Candidatus Pacearchaeota archaeon]|nr:acylphosphatase [Candidatus Pacearchaeota archaeon]
MKKSMRFFVSGSIQPTIFSRFIKENADKLNIKGFIRALDSGKMEIFVEGDTNSVTLMAPICQKGPRHSIIKQVEEKEEKYQGFPDFRVLNF